MTTSKIPILKAALKRMQEEQAAIVRCEHCDGFVQPKRFSVIALPVLDEGQPRLGKDGQPTTAYVRLPKHVLQPSFLDTTGLVPVQCEHGLVAHPMGKRFTGTASGYAKSWIRLKYIDSLGKCPVCRGEPAPLDLTGDL